MWHCPISLLIPRCTHFVGQLGAYNISMGVLYFPLILQYKLYNSLFRCLLEWTATSLDKPDFRINIHKVISLIINDFSMIMSFTNLRRQGSPILADLDRWIFLLEVDNTSAIICMSRLSHMQESHIMNLCRLFSHNAL